MQPKFKQSLLESVAVYQNDVVSFIEHYDSVSDLWICSSVCTNLDILLIISVTDNSTIYSVNPSYFITGGPYGGWNSTWRGQPPAPLLSGNVVNMLTCFLLWGEALLDTLCRDFFSFLQATFDELWRKFITYSAGEQLLGLPVTNYEALEKKRCAAMT